MEGDDTERRKRIGKSSIGNGDIGLIGKVEAGRSDSWRERRYGRKCGERKIHGKGRAVLVYGNDSKRTGGWIFESGDENAFGGIGGGGDAHPTGTNEFAPIAENVKTFGDGAIGLDESFVIVGGAGVEDSPIKPSVDVADGEVLVNDVGPSDAAGHGRIEGSVAAVERSFSLPQPNSAILRKGGNAIANVIDDAVSEDVVMPSDDGDIGSSSAIGSEAFGVAMQLGPVGSFRGHDFDARARKGRAKIVFDECG